MKDGQIFMFVVVVVAELKKAISHERWPDIHVCSSTGGEAMKDGQIFMFVVVVVAELKKAISHERWPDIHVCYTMNLLQQKFSFVCIRNA